MERVPLFGVQGLRRERLNLNHKKGEIRARANEKPQTLARPGQGELSASSASRELGVQGANNGHLRACRLI